MSATVARARRHLGGVPEQFVVTTGFDERLARDGQRAQARGETGDYTVDDFELSEARQIIVSAERFVAADDRRLDG